MRATADDRSWRLIGVGLACLLLACGGGSTPAGDAGVDLAIAGELGSPGDDLGAAADLAGVADLGGDGSSDGSAFDAAITPGNTITGLVTDDDGTPLAGFTVAIGAATTTTDASGMFTLADVTTPYTLLTGGLEPTGRVNPGATQLTKYIGLTRHDPVIVFHEITAALTSREATISGSIAVTGLDASATVALHSSVFPIQALDTFNGNAGTPLTYSSLPLDWSGPATEAQLFRALATLDGPFRYTHYAELAYAVTDGQTYSVPAITMSAISAADLTATVTSRAGALSTQLVDMMLLNGYASTLQNLSLGSATVSLSEPLLTGAVMQRDLYDTGASTPGTSHLLTRGAPGEALGAVTLETTSVPIAPAGAPSNVARDADFVVTPGQLGAVKRMVYQKAGVGCWSVVYTGASVKFPDGTAVGVAAPGTGVTMLGRLLELEDTSVDQTATAGAFARIHLGSLAGPSFHYGDQSLGVLAFDP